MTLVAMLVAGCFDFDRIVARDGGVDGGKLDAGASLVCGNLAVTTFCDGSEIFCDGFEDTSEDNPFPLWNGIDLNDYDPAGAPNPGTQLTVTTDRACEGQHALHAVTMGTNQDADLAKHDLTFPNPVYYRAFYYMPSVGATTQPFNLATLAVSYDVNLELGYDPRTGANNYTYYLNEGNGSASSPGALPLDRWFCLTAKVELDPTAGRVQLWIDRSLVMDASGVPTSFAGSSYTFFLTGLPSANASTEVFVDEVALSASPLGCD